MQGFRSRFCLAALEKNQIFLQSWEKKPGTKALGSRLRILLLTLSTIWVALADYLTLMIETPGCSTCSEEVMYPFVPFLAPLFTPLQPALLVSTGEPLECSQHLL